MDSVQKFQILVNERGQALRSKSRIDLIGLQTSPIEIVKIDGRAGTIGTIVEDESEGSLRVVVQGFLDSKWFSQLGVKSVALDGFRMNAEGEITALADEEFYGFD